MIHAVVALDVLLGLAGAALVAATVLSAVQTLAVPRATPVFEETHCSAPSLVYFRSPQPGRSWITAAGAVLDAAALVVSAVDVGRLASLCRAPTAPWSGDRPLPFRRAPLVPRRSRRTA